MQRLLITGGAGYLASSLIAAAQASGAWDVLATYHSRRPPAPAIEWLPLDIRDAPAVLACVANTRPAAIIHTAYVQAGAALWATTAEGAGWVAQAAAQADTRLIHLSSDALFDGERTSPYTEADDPSPITPYGAAKAAAEQLVATAHPGALIVRTSLIYGGVVPSGHEQLALDAAAGTSDTTFFSDEIRCPVHVSDLALALLELVPLDVWGRLHVAGADAVSRYEFACRIAAAAGLPTTTIRSGLSAASGLRRPRHCVLATKAARQLLQTPLRGVRQVLPSYPHPGEISP